MKMERRFTSVHQSLTFSRRMAIAAGAQTAVGALLLGRLGWLAIAENEKYSLESESNRVQLIIVPPRRGWIVDRHGKPIAINRSDFRVDIIPDQLENPEATLRELSQLLSLSPDDVDRILRDLKAAHGYQPIEVAESVPFDKYAAVTVRLPELPGVNPMRGFSRFYPDGPAVAHLVGFVGTASAADYEKDKNPLLITPGFKIGKEGLEKTLEPRLRGTPGRAARGAYFARQARSRARAQAGSQRQHRPADHRRRAAAICRPANGRPVGSPRRHGRVERRHACIRLNAGVRPQ